MRLTVLIVAGIELLLLAVVMLKLCLSGIKGDLAGQGMTLAYTVIGTALALLLLTPAVTLAYHSKLLWLDLVLAILASVFVLAVLVME